MSNNLLEEFFSLNIVETLEKYVAKISKYKENNKDCKIKQNTITRKI